MLTGLASKALAICMSIVLFPLAILGLFSSMGVSMYFRGGDRYWYFLAISLVCIWLSYRIYKLMNARLKQNTPEDGLIEIASGRRLWLVSAIAVWIFGLLFGPIFATATLTYLEAQS